MNNYIELVKEWLADPSSVTKEKLLSNANAAFSDYEAAYTDPSSVTEAELIANRAAEAAAYAAAEAFDGEAAYWVKRYEELSK